LADVSKLLYAPTAAPHLLRNLDADAASLIDARRKIRQCLRDAFASSSAAVFGRKVSPRFFTQGSHAYKTMNAPAWVPPQQKDLDDGCYLPLSFVRGARPSQAAKLFFTFVDAALKTLARQEGWTHKEKPTCVRLEISSVAHVDIPLYAIPDAEFVTLQSRMATKAMKDEAKVSPDTWESLPSDAVLLAHREEDWMQSDPRKIHEWFIDAVDNVHGESLRRDSRFLKAWRDHHRLDESHLSSILLMVCVWREYERLGESLDDEREDKRLLQVVERLPTHLNGPVQNPACDNDEDINRMSPEERRRVVGAAQNLCGHLRTIINSCSDQARAIELLRAAFGDRVPYRPDLVIVGGATLTVLSTPRTPVAAPEVGRSKTG
jgi:hypothetical protein